MSATTLNMISAVVVAIMAVSMAGACVTIGCVNGHDIEKHRFQREAIERGVAEYNATTGEWQWKE